MPIQKYMAFVKAAELGSFTKAAGALGYSQSGISRMIGDLEREWGISLLERRHTSVRLTADGQHLFSQIQRICNDYQELQAQVGELKGLHAGLIRIGTFSSVATHWLPNIIREFRKSYPEIEYEVLVGDYGEIEQWLIDGRVDCGFLRLPVSVKLDTVFLEEDQLMVVMPADHPLADCEKVPVKALGDYPFMLLEKDSKGGMADFLEKLGVAPNVYFTTLDDYSILSMVENGLGIGILPTLILQRTPFRVLRKELEVSAYRQICIAMPDRQSVSVAVARFLEYLPHRNTRPGPG